MSEYTGWLLDVYEDPQDGVALWLLRDDGQRRRLHQPPAASTARTTPWVASGR